MTLKTTLVAIAGLAAAAGAQTCPLSAQSESQATVRTVAHAGNDIVSTAMAAGSFNTLLAAAKAAGLAETLMGDGPFTVFAPTDEAFAKLPTGTVESLLKPENRDTLRAILTYHVVPGAVNAATVTRLNDAVTVNGQAVSIMATEHGVKVDDANVVKTDITCSNGIIHVIDRVILPSDKNIVEVASGAGSFNTLLAAAKAAGLAEALMGDGPFTIFAPTDEAFQALPAGTVESLLKPENKAKLASILKYHVVKGRVFAKDAVTAGTAPTLQGGSVVIDVREGRLTVDNANIISTDIDASNGVIHVIDRVILPR
ncbi:MAG: fasciclin domain-containing protein [Phycisphaerales bacterium]|nr:fasciclin domain-containing protein [Phycisphaerales bacterium]